MHQSVKPRVMRLNDEDNILLAAEKIEAGLDLGDGIRARQRIPFGHKRAAEPIGPGEPIRKFGQIIGFASQPIERGDWVREHNVVMREFERDCQSAQGYRSEAVLPVEEQATFQGFRRGNGRAGTRNYIGILTSVNCSASVARLVAEAAMRSGMLADYPDVDGIVSFTHGTGCGMSGSGEGFEVLKRTLWGYGANPNLGAVLLIGLGCEVFQIGRMKSLYGIEESETFRTMTIQESGGTRRTIEQGLGRIREMLPLVNAASREGIPRIGTDAGAAMRRVRRLFRHHRQPGARRRRRHPRRAWRNRNSFRNAGDLRRRAPPDAAGEEPRGRRQAGQAHPVVGRLHGSQWRRDEQQSIAWKQAGRPYDDPPKVSGRGRKGRFHFAQRGL